MADNAGLVIIDNINHIAFQFNLHINMIDAHNARLHRTK